MIGFYTKMLNVSNMLNSTTKSYLKLMIFVIMYVFSIIKYSFGQPIQKGLKTFNIDLVKKKIYG